MDYTTNPEKIKLIVRFKIEQLRFIQRTFLIVLSIGIVFNLTYSQLGFAGKDLFAFDVLAIYLLVALLAFRHLEIMSIKHTIEWLKDSPKLS